MASSTKNVKLGVCRAFFGGVDLGLTKGGVEVTMTTETYKVEVDQFGKTPIKEQIQGRTVMAKVPMAETTLQNMAMLTPGAALVTDGVRAFASVTFAANPTATTTVTIAGQAFTFAVGTPTTVFAVKIGATLQETIDRFNSVVNRSQLAKATGGVVAVQTAPTVVIIRAVEPGSASNAVTIAATLGGTASGTTLIGGIVETMARLDVSTGIGVDLLDLAQELRLHPANKPDTDFSEDFVILQAATPGAMQFAYKLDAERIFNADFMGYPDPVTGKLFVIGNTAM
jgi:hypothetical protein